MRPLGINQFGAAAGPSVFVKANSGITTATTISLSMTGAAAGDLAVVFIANGQTTTITPPAGWALVDSTTWSGYGDGVLSKLLTAGDISAGSVTFTGVTYDTTLKAGFYRGPTSIRSAGRAVSVAPAASVTVPGFTKSANCRGVVTSVTSRDVGSAFVKPAPTVQRLATFQSAGFDGNGGNFVSRLDDIVDPATYANGTALTYSIGTAFPSQAWAIELLG